MSPTRPERALAALGWAEMWMSVSFQMERMEAAKIQYEVKIVQEKRRKRRNMEEIS